MNKELVKQLILYIIDQLRDQGGIISKIRLVKLLYLIDVEYYHMSGKTLTGLTWIFYHYGPYAFDIDIIIKELGFNLSEESITTSIGQSEYTYHVRESQSIYDTISFAHKSMIDRIIKQWALEETRFILDYVYTSTEPMQSATFGQALDFSTIQRGINRHRPVKQLKLDKKKSAMIQKLLQRRQEQQSKLETSQPRYDEAYFEAMKVMDYEDIFEGAIGGKVKITAESVEAIRNQIE